MNVLNIAWKDLLLYVKDRSALLELFVLPVVFTFILVGLTSGFYNEDENADEAVPLAVANLDEGGAMAGRLLDALAENAGFRIDQIDPTESQMLLVEGDIPRLLTIPAGFTAALEAGERVTLDLRVSSDDIQENEAVRLAVEGVARSLSMQRQIVAGLEQVAGLAEADPESQAPFPAEQTIAQAESQFAPSAARPLVVVRQETPSSLTEGREDASFDSVQIGVPGVTVLFVFLTAQSTAQSIYQEKRTGSFRRLLSAPMSKATLLAGKMLPTLLISLVQVAVIFATARFIFPLIGLGAFQFGESPLALVLLVLVVALCSTGLGVLIAALAHTQAQIGGIAALILWVAALIGGSLMPIFLFSPFLASLSRLTPHGWANIAFYNVLVRGRDLADIAPALLALLGFTALFVAIGLWRFKFE